MLDYTTSVAFELSNVCPFAWMHTRCPLNLEMASPWRVREPRHLPAKIVSQVLAVLAEHGYRREICFHQYNEPLADPRLMGFIREARQACPSAWLVLLSNGFGLSEQLVAEMAEAGLTQILVTLYGDAEDRAAMDRFIKGPVRRILPESNVLLYGDNGLDNRMAVYDTPYRDSRRKCSAPLSTITITRDADVALCCRDWRRTVTFGNLKDKPLGEMLPEMADAYRRLMAGDRSVFDVCRRCEESLCP